MTTIPQLRKQLVAVVDHSTTMICLDAAGQIRDLDKPFRTLVGDFQHPPFHRWCRTVVIPYLPGFVTDERTDANTEINRRPLEQRRKGPAGVGARAIPGPHDATHERRLDVLPGDLDLDTAYASLLAPLNPPSEDRANSLRRYLHDHTTDRQLRLGALDGEHAQLVDALDTALRDTHLAGDTTLFTAIDPKIARQLEVSDLVSDDSYLIATLDPARAATYGTPIAMTLPAGHPAAALDPATHRVLLPRRHTWRLIALGVIFIAILL